MTARPQQRILLLRHQPALAALLLLALLAGPAADAFTLSCFRGKGSSAGAGAAAYCAHQRPLPGTDAFAQVRRNREEAFWKADRLMRQAEGVDRSGARGLESVG